MQPDVFRTILEQFPTGEWQVVQEPQGLRVLVADFTGNDSDLEATLRKMLETRGVLLPAIQIERVASIPRSAVGKAPLVKRLWPIQSVDQANHAPTV